MNTHARVCAYTHTHTHTNKSRETSEKAIDVVLRDGEAPGDEEKWTDVSYVLELEMKNWSIRCGEEGRRKQFWLLGFGFGQLGGW